MAFDVPNWKGWVVVLEGVDEPRLDDGKALLEAEALNENGELCGCG